MAVVILQKDEPVTKDALKKVLEDYTSFVKITVDLKKGIVALGGGISCGW